MCIRDRCLHQADCFFAFAADSQCQQRTRAFHFQNAQTADERLFPVCVRDNALQLTDAAPDLVQIPDEQEPALMEQPDAVADIFQLP